jgi:hypothetical protein
MCMILGGIIHVDFDAAYQLLTVYSALFKYFKKWEYNGAGRTSCSHRLQNSL